ncbi:MAG: low temperature requirement protein A [Acidimicrobiia bacterium]
MTTSVFRRLWQPPARYEDRARERHVSFLELFFDLVFVVIVAQLAHRLAEHPDWAGVGWFVFIFYAVWSSWVNGTLYYDLHGTDDVSVRVFTFAQMLAVGVMGVYVGDVPGEGSVGFAIAYAANLLILAVIWFRTGLHDPHHRPASNPYSAAYLISALVFATSVLVEAPTRYWLWGGALLIAVAGQAIAFSRWTPPESQEGDAVIATTPSLIERFGLFVIIVLGEVIVGAVTGMADLTPLDAGELVIGLFGVLIAIGMWWIYFDLVSHREPVSRKTQLWSYLHFPLVVAIAAGGAGVLNTVEHASDPLPDEVRWLLVGALAVAMASVALLTTTLVVRRDQPELYRNADIAILISAALALGVGVTDWGAKETLGALGLLLLAPVVVGIVVWLKPLPDRAEVEIV